MKPSVSSVWRLHLALCALVLLFGAGSAAWMLRDPGTSIGAALAALGAFVVVVAAGVYTLLSSLGLAVIRGLRRDRAPGMLTVLGVHALTLATVVGLPIAWPGLRSAHEHRRDRDFADCVQISSCAYEPSSRAGETGYAVHLGVDLCRDMHLGANILAYKDDPFDKSVLSNPSLDQELEEGPNELELFAPADDTTRPRSWGAELWERSGWPASAFGPNAGRASWLPAPFSEDLRYKRLGVEQRVMPDCEPLQPG